MFWVGDGIDSFLKVKQNNKCLKIAKKIMKKEE